ncbi:MAG: rhomboid family intramembrane serine protease [Bacteroidia bacterium]|nr:rhomboid family intramembrane serine protease [Bacteroidia bacterium]
MLPLRDINPSRAFPLLTGMIIAINAWVFIEHYQEGVFFEEALYQLGYIPALGFSLERAITSMFMHGSWAHLLFNMWTLWVFGDNIEEALGKLGYLLLYAAAGVGAVLLHSFLYPTSEVPVVGASGAISGVMGAYLSLYPRARILTWVPPWFITSLPARVFLILWFVLQVVQGVVDRYLNWMMGEASGVAFWAHVGGFGVGWGLAVFLRDSRLERDSWADLR